MVSARRDCCRGDAGGHRLELRLRLVQLLQELLDRASPPFRRGRRSRRRGRERPSGDLIGCASRLLFHAELRDLTESTRHGLHRFFTRHPPAQCAQRQFRDQLQGLEDADAGRGDSLDRLVPALRIQSVEHRLDGCDVWNVALVQLKNEWDLVEVQSDLSQVLTEISEAVDVRIEHRLLRVGYEDESVNAFQDELAGGVVEHLTWNRVELQAGLET